MNNLFQDSILSPTFINLYLSCPYAAYLRYIEKYQPQFIDDTYLKIGKSGHQILEHWYDEINLDSLDIEQEFMEKLKMVAFKYWDRSIDSKKRDEVEPALFLWLKSEIQKYMNYKKQGCTDRFKPTSVEQDITDYNKRIRAVIDKRCIGISGINYCMDYKFDTKLPANRNFECSLSNIDLKYKIQAALNYQVLKSQNINIGAFYFQFIRYPEKLLSVPLTDSLFKEIDELILKIRNDTTFDKNPKSCYRCNFKMMCKLESKSVFCL